MPLREFRRQKRRFRRRVLVLFAAFMCIAVSALVYVVVYMFRPDIPQVPQPSGSTQSGPSSNTGNLPSGGASVSMPQSSGAPQSGGSPQSSQSSAANSGGSSGLILLVNKDNPLPEDFKPDLVEIPSSYFYSEDKDRHFDRHAAPNLMKMFDDAEADGIYLRIYSGYRTHKYQEHNFQNKVDYYCKLGYTSSAAVSEAARIVAPPGTSEHETGLSCDIVSAGWRTDLNETFEQTDAFRWLMAHCADYGFILRYPKDKTDITQYDYEPWHYRYVGAADAKKIMQQGLCLEEYLQQAGR